MPPNRDQLDQLQNSSLQGSKVALDWNGERKIYELAELINEQGRTSATWKAKDTVGRVVALKFVLRGDYVNHSLAAETARVNELETELISKIAFFGELNPIDCDVDGEMFYGIVVDWADGISLHEYVLSDAPLDPSIYRSLARDLCEILIALNLKNLSHSDLHDKNIIIQEKKDLVSSDHQLSLRVIDSGHLKTEERRIELQELWSQSISTLEPIEAETPGTVDEQLSYFKDLVSYFGRTDQEWVVSHFCTLYNKLRRSIPDFDGASKRFVRSLPGVLRMMIDDDPSRRVSDPQLMFAEIERLWSECATPEDPKKLLRSPFDLPSAELIRNDSQLMALFSEEYPKLNVCRSDEPVYLYGPRGCGKSTIFRSLSLKAVLSSDEPELEQKKIPFVGVYLSSSQELRSRFWLMDEPDFEQLEGHVIRYFSLLLVESLVETLNQDADLGFLVVQFFQFWSKR